uniref:Uncharacterized protein n=1 Tax=Schizaphis graminum TaxID=13262 RepID=A0A2S2NYM6_SCHGA
MFVYHLLRDIMRHQCSGHVPRLRSAQRPAVYDEEGHGVFAYHVKRHALDAENAITHSAHAEHAVQTAADSYSCAPATRLIRGVRCVCRTAILHIACRECL